MDNDCMNNSNDKSSVKRMIWQFWTGENELTPNRLKCLKSNVNLGVETKLIRGNDIYNMQIKSHPFHPAFKWLSYTHKADYLRCYFMHFYGGGYADIKTYSINNNWKYCFDVINSDESIWMVGQKEKMGGSSIKEYNSAQFIEKLSATCYFIFRPNTDLTYNWLDKVEQKLEEKQKQLEICWDITKHHPNICNDLTGTNVYNCKQYPFRWAEILGNIIHPLEIDFYDKKHIVNILDSGRTRDAYR